MRSEKSLFEKTALSTRQSFWVLAGLIIILNGAPVAMAQWVNIGPPPGYITALAIDPQESAIMFAGTNTGVYKSVDSGYNWNRCLRDFFIYALAVDPLTPSTIYAGTQAGVYRSTDGGTNWELHIEGMSYHEIHALAIDPKTPTTIYAGSVYGACSRAAMAGEAGARPTPA
jgi:hypothetical protein